MKNAEQQIKTRPRLKSQAEERSSAASKRQNKRLKEFGGKPASMASPSLESFEKGFSPVSSKAQPFQKQKAAAWQAPLAGFQSFRSQKTSAGKANVFALGPKLRLLESKTALLRFAVQEAKELLSGK